MISHPCYFSVQILLLVGLVIFVLHPRSLSLTEKTELLDFWHSMGVLMTVVTKSLPNDHWNGIAYTAPMLPRERKCTPRFVRILRLTEIRLCPLNTFFFYSFWKYFIGRREVQKNTKRQYFVCHRGIETRMNTHQTQIYSIWSKTVQIQWSGFLQFLLKPLTWTISEYKNLRLQKYHHL